MKFQFDLLIATRDNFLRAVENLSIEALNHIPEHFNNNLIWHLGHVVVTHQRLCYGKSNIPCLVSDDLIDRYCKGTRPESPVEAAEIDEIKELLYTLPQVMITDYIEGKFSEYEAYEISYGVKLTNIEKAMAFNNVHEGLHLGYVMSMRKSLG